MFQPWPRRSDRFNSRTDCRQVWLEKFQCKEENGWSARAPCHSNKDASTNKYKVLWSDFNTGKCDAWDPVAVETLEMRYKAIVEWRKNDETQGFVGQNFAMMLCEEATKKTASSGSKRQREEEEDDEEEDQDPRKDYDPNFKGFVIE